MKLLFVLPEFGPAVTGGIATYYRHLLPELVRHGHAVHVVLASANAGEPAEQLPGVNVSRVDRAAIETEKRGFGALAAAPHLQHRLARARAAWRLAGGGQGFDVVETTDFGDLFAPWAAMAARPPLLVQLHGSNGQLLAHDPLAGDELEAYLTRLVEVSLLGRADELQSYGGPNAREWSTLLGKEVVHLWPAWRATRHAPANSLPDGVEGLVVGRVQSWKGPDVLCAALRRLGRDAPTIGWVGSDTPFRRGDRSTGTYLANEYPDVWGRKLVPLGRRVPAETASMQAAARFVVVPSKWDVFNLSAVEAMDAGRVVICSEGAGAAELIREAESGYRFRPADAVALAERVRQARGLGDGERRRVGEAARAAVVSELDPDKVIGQRLARYEALAAAPAAIDRRDLSYLTGFGEPVDDPFAFLGRLPMRRLVRHVLQRGLERLWKTLGR
jgi:glycosyltransferase involved in cell wall biosynthesis